MDYMNIDNNPGREARLMGEFKSFTKDRFKEVWNRVIGGEESIVREKQVKRGQEPPVIKIEKITGVKAMFDAGKNNSIISWKDEEGAEKDLPINRDYFVGVQRAQTGQEAVVIMNTSGDRQTIRKYYKGE